MKSSIALFILGVLTVAVIACSVFVFLFFNFDKVDKILGYLPILIAIYCTTSSLSRFYNLYVKYEENEQKKYR